MRKRETGKTESPLSTPELAQKYPYVLNSGPRNSIFFHSANRQIPWLREIRPDPLMELHPETTKKHGI
jgi:anaerobic selenocysteine-containing dehydrogenase